MRAVICGAGIAGLAVANRLCHRGWDVHVVERAPGPRTQGYMIDFFGPGFQALTAMGLQPRLRELASQAESFGYLDAHGRETVRVDYGRFAKAMRGEMVSIMRPDLERLLRESVEGSVDLRYGTTVDRLADGPSRVTVTLSDGTTLDADLVVGADGVHSRIRSLVFGPEREYFRYLGMHTAAYVFEDHEVFQRVAGRFVLTETLSRQLGYYGLRDDRVAVFAVHRTEDPTLPDDPRDELRRRYAGMGALADRALARCPSPEEIYYDQVAQIDLPRWTAGRVALVGDAAYAVSLVAGQGASLGVAGAYVLAERLHAAPSVPEALADYERRWRPVAMRVQRAARTRVTEWFLPTSPVKLLLRRWAFRAVALPGIDRLLIGSLFPKATHTVGELSA